MVSGELIRKVGGGIETYRIPFRRRGHLKKWYSPGDERGRCEYCQAVRAAKRALARARLRAYDEL